jgi:hypothetical protein
MIPKSLVKTALRRLALIFGVSLLFVLAISEIAHALQREDFDRPAEIVSITIPAGTAQKVAAGQDEPSIPAELSFVVGDTLLVYNDDSADHELGPLFIPAGASASLLMSDANQFEIACSFRPSQFLGLTVQEATTLNIRLVALAYVTPATTIFIFLYSLALWPLKKEQAA